MNGGLGLDIHAGIKSGVEDGAASPSSVGTMALAQSASTAVASAASHKAAE